MADALSCRPTKQLESSWIAMAFLPIFWAASDSSLPAQHKSIIQSPSSDSEWTILFSKSSLDFVWKLVVLPDRTSWGISTKMIIERINILILGIDYLIQHKKSPNRKSSYLLIDLRCHNWGRNKPRGKMNWHPLIAGKAVPNFYLLSQKQQTGHVLFAVTELRGTSEYCPNHSQPICWNTLILA